MSFTAYDINFNKLAVWLLNKALRKQKFLIFANAFLYPLNYLRTNFFNYRKAKLYELSITPQVCYLQKMLNDKYDSNLRRIRIDDAEWHLPMFLFQEDEDKPQYLYQESENNPVALYTDGESGEALNDFVVLVPSAISFPLAEMQSLVDKYKLFGTKYSIQRT